MWRSNRGAISVLCVSVILPLLLVVIAVGVELQQFYGVREYVQQVVDDRVRLGIARHYPVEEVEREIRGALVPLLPQVGSFSFASVMEPGRGEVNVRAEYRGAFGSLTGLLIGVELGAIPFAVSSDARRFHSTALIVLDRTFTDGGDGCTDVGLRERGEVVDELSAALRAHGVTNIRVGVVPGVQSALSILPVNSEDSRLVDCEGTTSLPLQMTSIRGAIDDAFGPLEVGQEIAESFVAGVAGDTESLSIIFVGPESERFVRTVDFAHAFMKQAGAAQKLSMRNVVLSQVREGTVTRESPIFGVPYLQFVAGAVLQRELITSVSGHVGGPVMVAR